MTKGEKLGGSSLLMAGAGLAALLWYSQKKASAPIAGVGCPDPRLGQFDFESTIPTDPTPPDLPLPDPSFADIGTGPASTIVALPDGSTIDITDANQFVDPNGQSYTAAWDGSMIYPDGTVIKPDGAIMTPGGTVVNPDYSMTLTNGETVPAATPLPDGSGTSADMIAKLVGQGLTVAAATLTTLQKFGITPSGHIAPGATSPTGWVSGTQYRTASGQIVTPSKLANGLYQLPDGTTIGTPPESGMGMGMLAVLGVGAFLLLRR